MANSSCLWTKARENLPVDVKEWLASLEQGIQTNATATEQIDALIEQTAKKHKDLEKSNHRFRKYFDKIIHWLDKVKGIGDVISSFDPVHAALPWAAFRFALQAALAEREHAESVLELLSSTPHFVFSGRVLEMVYTRESMHVGKAQDDIRISQQCLDHLQEELIKFYSGLFSALQYCYTISRKHKVKRKATAIFNSSEVVSVHKDLQVQHKKVITCGDNCHKILNHALSLKSLELLEKLQPSLAELGDRVRELLIRIDEAERHMILRAISSILFRAHHEEVSRKRTVGTCEWILNKKTFLRWEEGDSSVTVLYGNPGAGKTFLVSRVVDYTIERAKRGEAVAFFYCKRDEENRRSPKDILRSILRQLSTPVKEVEPGMIHVALMDLPNRLELKGTTIDISTCEHLIGKLVEDYSKTTIVIDALDECDRNTRDELMGVMRNLLNGSSKLHIFISSRPDEDIRRHFKDTPFLEMQATDNEEDISSFVEERLFGDSRWADIRPNFQEEVKSVFYEKSQGMFQWAALQVDQIRRLKLWSERSIKEQLETSPIGLKGAYDVVWNQIQEMSPYEEQLARRAFQWVLCAFRPLETSDLLLMMQIDPCSGTIEADTVFMPDTIQSICGNLLVHDQKSNVWRFSHLSAREYIEMHHYNMLESHHHAAISSIKFLERDLIPLPRDTKSIREPESRLSLWVVAPNRPHPDGPCVSFTVQCRYIIEYVLRHVHELDLPMFRHSELSNLVRNFFQPVSQGSSHFQAWKRHSIAIGSSGWRVQSIGSEQSRPLQTSSTPLQVMSIYGVFHILRDLWDGAGNEVNVFPKFSPSPLTLAIINRHESVWRFILLAKAKINNGHPGPLAAAIECDDIKAFEAILEADADVNYFQPRQSGMLTKGSELRRGNTPLNAALCFSRKKNRRYFIQRLLGGGADVNLKTRGRTTLELAIQFADEETVKLLLDANTKVYNPNHFLSLAAQNPRFNLVPMFANLGANVEEPWEGVLPLVWALKNGNISIVQYLLEMPGISIDLSCQDHREAILSILCDFDRSQVFHFLFGSKPHINWTDSMTYPLERVLRSYPKYEHELRALGFNGSKFALQCIEGTAHRQLRLVDTLFNAGPDPSVSVDFGFGSTITAAAFHNRLHYVRAVLDQERFHVRQAKERAFFRNALFLMMSGHLVLGSRKSSDNQLKTFSNECLYSKHLEVLQLLFDGDLDVYMPINDFLDPLVTPVLINVEGYEISHSCRLYVKGYFGCFSRFWFSIMWDLQNGTSPHLPLGLQLRQLQFPGILPQRCYIVAKVTANPRALPTYFIKLSVQGDRCQFMIVPARREVRGSLNHGSEHRRWKRYKPECFGIMRLPDQYGGTVSSNTEVQAVCGKFEAYLTSCYRNRFASVLLAFVVVLLSFFMALPQFTQGT
ncbi:het-E-1 heterokaryon incompatibility protein [Fusarium pseudocircinatum]|uniref:Het-E-1 heterokaryon incompatibility protein n=1 Tax=Fusarium pseudocircinatum TaxID=56676 RepID=A0A8H5PCI3_9HYPO|nr:het-E-1 heterokaryon incompatibility protein [Fusarium pseudocircinatum]